MRINITTGIAIVLTMVIGGCCEGTREVLFTVNDNPYYRDDFERDIELRAELFQHKKPIRDDEKLQQAKRALTSSILRTKLEEILLLQLARGSGNADCLPIASIELKYATTFGLDGEVFESLLASLSSRASESLKKQIEKEAICESYLQRNFSNELSVTEALIDETIRSMHRGDELAQMTNAVIYATASNVWQRAMSGEDFATLADQFTQEDGVAAGGDIGGNCDFNDFQMDDPGVWNIVSKLQSGEVTPPIDTIEGLTIYKCHERRDDAQAVGGTAYHFARIVFHRALTYENYDRDYIRRELSKDRRNKLINRILGDLIKCARVKIIDVNHVLPKKFTDKFQRRGDGK